MLLVQEKFLHETTQDTQHVIYNILVNLDRTGNTRKFALEMIPKIYPYAGKLGPQMLKRLFAIGNDEQANKALSEIFISCRCCRYNLNFELKQGG